MDKIVQCPGRTRGLKAGSSALDLADRRLVPLIAFITTREQWAGGIYRE
jgi:hypothetical protein